MDNETIEKWQKIFAEQLESGKPVRAFCRDNGISSSSFYSYKAKLEKLGLTDVPTAPAEETAETAEQENAGNDVPAEEAEEAETAADSVSEEEAEEKVSDKVVWYNTVCLIDTENIGKEWPAFMMRNTGISSFVLFYTPSSAGISVPDFMKLLHSNLNIEAISCYTGKNALDFQLVTYLGSLIATHPDWSFCILSNDTGYDSAVKFWRDRGVNIARCKVRDRLFSADSAETEAKEIPAEKEENPKKAQEPKPVKKTVKETAPAEAADKAVPAEEIADLFIRRGASEDDKESGELFKVAQIIADHRGDDKAERKTKIYQAFFTVFGKKNGQDLYSKYKKAIGNVLSDTDAKAAKN